MWFDGALMLDLTEIFGAGKEPTKEWLDENIPWFLGEYTYYDPPEKVLNLNSEKEEGNRIKISWTKTEDDIDFYRIYKDNIIFGEVLDPLPLFEFPFSNESLTFPMLLFSDLNDMFFETDIPIRTEIYFSVVVDTVPPVLTVTSPEDNLVTNQNTVTVSGTTNDATSGPVTLKVNDVPVTVQENGTFTYEFTLSEGENTITIVSTDSAGKSSTVVRHVRKDTGAPVFQEISITPNPVDAGKTYIISVKVVDA